MEEFQNIDITSSIKIVKFQNIAITSSIKMVKFQNIDIPLLRTCVWQINWRSGACRNKKKCK